MILRRLAVALALTAAMPPAWAADLLTIYRDARVSDPVYQAARAQYAATREKLPQARAGYLPLVTGTVSVFRNEVEREIAGDLYYTTKTYAVTLSQLFSRSIAIFRKAFGYLLTVRFFLITSQFPFCKVSQASVSD